MEFAGAFCPSRVGRPSKAAAAGVREGFCRAAAAVAVIGCVGSPAFADTVILPDPTWGATFLGTNVSQSVTGPDLYTLPITGPFVSGSMSFIGQGEPFPSITASVRRKFCPGPVRCSPTLRSRNWTTISRLPGRRVTCRWMCRVWQGGPGQEAGLSRSVSPLTMSLFRRITIST